jgi:hypothetical protein
MRQGFPRMLTYGLAVVALACVAASGTAIGNRGDRDTGRSVHMLTNSPSGEAIPVGDLPGWKQVYRQEFTRDVALGAWPGPYRDSVDYYADGTPDTRGQRGGPGRYHPSDVISVSDGVLRKHLHTDGGVARVATILPIIRGDEHGFVGQRYGRFAVRFRADALEDYKIAWLLWPTSDDWDDGEINFPEGHLPDTIEGFSHPVGTGRPSPELEHPVVDTGEPFTEWHTAVIEWTPGRVDFILDGETVGSITDHVPTATMRWTLQTETSLFKDPDPGVAGDVEIDWMAVWRPT